MDKRIRIMRSIGLSLAVLMLLSCQFVSSLLDGQTAGVYTPTAAFTLAESSVPADQTATLTQTFLPSPLAPTATLTLSADDPFTNTPTWTATLASTQTPAPTYTLGTALPSYTPFPTVTPFRTATPTHSGPLIIDLNGYWVGVRRFDANCGKCDTTSTSRAIWNMYHVENSVGVNIGLTGSINGTVVTLSGTEKWITGTGWLKLTYILTLQPDGNTLKGRFWGEGRLPSSCVGDFKLINCDIANGSITMER
ncbi:hypothetical protein ACFLZW_04895 [Chloroflexota bacterium]